MSSILNFGSQSENTYECFLDKIDKIKNQYSNLFKTLDFDFESLFLITNDHIGIKYEFRDNFKKLQLEEQNEIELSFNEALKSCLDKYSA